MPRYKTGLDSALCPGLSLCCRPAVQQEVSVTGGKVEKCLAMIQEVNGNKRLCLWRRLNAHRVVVKFLGPRVRQVWVQILSFTFN